MNRPEAEDFLFHEAGLLDRYRLKEWLDLTSDDFVLWIPVNDEDADASRHVSIIHESREQLEVRVFRIIESGLHHPQDPPSRTVRFITNVQVERSGDDDHSVVRCNLGLVTYRSHAQRRDTVRPLSHAARCEYGLRQGPEGWRMTSKKMVFVDLDGPLDALTYVL